MKAFSSTKNTAESAHTDLTKTPSKLTQSESFWKHGKMQAFASIEKPLMVLHMKFVARAYLMAGAKVSKEFSTAHRFRPEGNLHTIVIVVKCREGVRSRDLLIQDNARNSSLN
jgi:hypothetical protein